MPTDHAKVNDILSGCEGLLNDFSLPGGGEHKDRFISIDASKQGLENGSVTSSPHGSPGQPASSSSVVDAEMQRSKKAWGRAIDRYVASVLEDHHSSKEEGSSGASRSARSKKSTRSSKRKSQHPDSYLLSALQGGDNASVSSHASVDIDGHIDDSSFAPINTRGGDEPGNYQYGRRERIKRYLRQEWKPISLIVLVIFVAIVVSASMGGGGGDSSNGQYVDPSISATDDVDNTPAAPPPPVQLSPPVPPTPHPVEVVVDTAIPTYSPTAFPTTDGPATAEPTSDSVRSKMLIMCELLLKSMLYTYLCS